MNRALVGALLVAAGCKKPPDDGMLVKMTGFADQMCKCNDEPCVTKVIDAMQAWTSTMAKPSDAKPDPALMKLVERYSECMTTVINKSAGSAPPPPPPKPAPKPEVVTGDVELLVARAMTEVGANPLSDLALEYVKSDGTLDGTYGKLTVRTAKRPANADDPSRPLGAPVAVEPTRSGRDDCPFIVVEHSTWSHTAGTCHSVENLAHPHCGAREVWRQAIVAGAPPAALASLRLEAYGSGQHWYFTIDDGPRNVHFRHLVPDDCAAVVEQPR